MTAQPQWSPVDEETGDLLALISSDPRHAEDEARFLAACKADADAHNGVVSVNNVRARLSNQHGLTIEPRRLSALWNAHTGRGKAMRYSGEFELYRGTGSGNDGKPVRTRVWRGES